MEYPAVKNAHIVPRSYLKHFAADDEKTISAHLKEEPKRVSTTSVDNVGTRRFFYRRQRPDGTNIDDTEWSLSELERKTALSSQHLLLTTWLDEPDDDERVPSAWLDLRPDGQAEHAGAASSQRRRSPSCNASWQPLAGLDLPYGPKPPTLGLPPDSKLPTPRASPPKNALSRSRLRLVRPNLKRPPDPSA